MCGKIRPEMSTRQLLIGSFFFIFFQSKDGFIKKWLVMLAQMISKVIHQSESAHQINFRARGVEDSGIALLFRFHRNVDQTFIDSPNHFRIDRYFLIKWAVFRDGEVMLLQKIENLLEHLIGDDELVSVGVIQFVRFEEAAIQIRRLLYGIANFRRQMRKLAIATVERTIEGFEEKYLELTIKK